MLLTTDLLFHYLRCPRRTYQDIYGNPAQKDKESDFLLKLQQDSLENRQAVVSQMDYQEPQYSRGDFAAGAAATLELMRGGAPIIYNGVLLAKTSENFTLVSTPDLLIKTAGESIFGNWLYLPADIKMGKRPKTDYQIIVAFHAHLLSSVQGVLPPGGFLLLRNKGPYQVNILFRLPQMLQSLSDCIAMLEKRQEPEMFISRHPCSTCHWFSSCHQLAKQTKHLSLIPGVTPSRYAQLKTLNLTTVESIAAAKPEMLSTFTEFERVADQLVLQAQAFVENRGFITDAGFAISKDELPTAPVEIYFDIEAKPEANITFLHGVLVVNRLTKTEDFYPLLAKNTQDEVVIWHKFLDLAMSYPDAPIFHFCDYEFQMIKNLANRYKTPQNRWYPLLERCVDIHERITRTTVLPIESYALKTIARWLGFQWRDTSANGAQCVYWYDRWIKTGDHTFLDAITRYNEDDCRATYLVKDWLVSFLQNTQPTATILSS